MGIGKFIRKFLTRQRGTTAVEFAIICPVFFLLIFGVIDFSRLLWHWQMAEKSTQFGVRQAVVSDLIPTGMDFDGIPLAGGAGAVVPIADVNGGAPVTCTSTGPGNAACDAMGPANAAGFDEVVARMQQIYDDIDHTNVEIIYQHIGLGFAGNPLGPDIIPLVTVRLTGMQFVFMTPGLAGLVNINMEGFEASLTGEDLAS